jgi:hypothetical protein
MSVAMDAACSAALTLEPCSSFRDNVTSSLPGKVMGPTLPIIDLCQSTPSAHCNKFAS